MNKIGPKGQRSLRLEGDTLAAVDKAADQDGVKPAPWMRWAIKEMLRKRCLLPKSQSTTIE